MHSNLMHYFLEYENLMNPYRPLLMDDIKRVNFLAILDENLALDGLISRIWDIIQEKNEILLLIQYIAA